MNQSVGIIDYGVNNIASVTKALNKVDVSYKIIQNPNDVADVRHLVLPGVGSFDQGCENLDQTGLMDAIRISVNDGTFLLAICLGMQLLFESSDESRNLNVGLSLIGGSCRKLSVFGEKNIRVPHVGWNSIIGVNSSRLLPDVMESGDVDVYFVHSYYVLPDDPTVVKAECQHGVRFPAIIECGNIFGTQFHPEKSGQVGLQILNRFASLS